MMIFQKSSSRFHKTNIFEGRKVSLGAQNRPQEAPRGGKKRHRKTKKEKRRKQEPQGRQKELQKVLLPFDLLNAQRKGEQFGRPRPLGSPHARGLINNYNDQKNNGQHFIDLNNNIQQTRGSNTFVAQRPGEFNSPTKAAYLRVQFLIGSFLIGFGGGGVILESHPTVISYWY